MAATTDNDWRHFGEAACLLAVEGVLWGLERRSGADPARRLGRIHEAAGALLGVAARIRRVIPDRVLTCLARGGADGMGELLLAAERLMDPDVSAGSDEARLQELLLASEPLAGEAVAEAVRREGERQRQARLDLTFRTDTDAV